MSTKSTPKSKSGFRLVESEEQTDEFHRLKSLETLSALCFAKPLTAAGYIFPVHYCFPRRKYWHCIAAALWAGLSANCHADCGFHLGNYLPPKKGRQAKPALRSKVMNSSFPEPFRGITINLFYLLSLICRNAFCVLCFFGNGDFLNCVELAANHGNACFFHLYGRGRIRTVGSFHRLIHDFLHYFS